jgi:hypothetical protein
MAETESEFGGNGVQRNGVFPPPHVPTTAEQLTLLYRTGDIDGTKPPDGGLAFTGMIDPVKQLEIRTAEGVMAKGEEWERIVAAGEAAIAALGQVIPDV